MNKLLKTALKKIGQTLLDEVFKDLQVVPTLINGVKSKFLYTLTINNYDSESLHRSLTRFLVKKI